MSYSGLLASIAARPAAAAAVVQFRRPFPLGLPAGFYQCSLGTLLSTLAEFRQIYSHGRFPSGTEIDCSVLGAAPGLILSPGRSSDSARDRPGQQALAAQDQ